MAYLFLRPGAGGIGDGKSPDSFPGLTRKQQYGLDNTINSYQHVISKYK
jgi:hypothetical protein